MSIIANARDRLTNDPALYGWSYGELYRAWLDDPLFPEPLEQDGPNPADWRWDMTEVVAHQENFGGVPCA